MTAHAAELADPTFLDDRLAHWAEATPTPRRSPTSAARGRGRSGTTAYAAWQAP